MTDGDWMRNATKQFRGVIKENETKYLVFYREVMEMSAFCIL
jgi:hypothetical protein